MPTPPFILELRKKIGHDELLLPGVTGVVVNSKREVLLVRTVHDNRWMPVGGCVEPGEEPADCILREIFEETGQRAAVVRLSSVDALGSVTYSNGDRCCFVTTTFLCRPRDESQVPRVADEESTEVRYFAADALPEMRPQHQHRIEQAMKGETAAHFRLCGGESTLG